MNTTIIPHVFSKTLWAYRFQLPENLIQYLWKQIEDAETKNVNFRSELAGNISKSLVLEDPDNIICDNIFPNLYRAGVPFDSIINRTYKTIDCPYVVDGKIKTDDYILNPKLGGLWVNFQKKHEFNPIHNHHGMFSFVIWMKIPYRYEDEKELPFVKGSTVSEAVGNFVTVYSDGETVRTSTFVMSPEVNGTMMVFPSTLMHQVYPFYTSDEERITISGNVYYVKNDIDTKQPDSVKYEYGI